MFNSDGDIQARMKAAKEKAEKISTGRYDTYEECIMVLQWAISNRRNIPLWSQYFEDLTLDQLVFEYEMIKVSEQSPEDRAQEIVENNQEEMQGLFDDWADEDTSPAQVSKEWVDSMPESAVMSEEEILAEERKFMETGEFEQE